MRNRKHYAPKWLIEKRKAGLMPSRKQVRAQLDFLGTVKRGSKNDDETGKSRTDIESENHSGRTDVPSQRSLFGTKKIDGP